MFILRFSSGGIGDIGTMHNHYPEELVEEVRSHNDIVDVVSDYVKLERKGKDYFGLCPFHKEKTPSFSVVPAKGIYYCFGCGKGGNVFQFIMNAENLPYVEALKLLADRARISLPESDSEEDREKAKTKQSILSINVEAARFFHNQLSKGGNKKAVEYLDGRKILPGTIKKFGIGYSPESWDALLNHLKDLGNSENLLLKSGLILPKKDGGYYDRFRGRIIFPIFDIRGNVIGFGGRVLDGSMPKYLNSPDTPVYSKGRHLYGMNFAKNSKDGRIIIVEGYMDAVSLHQNGIGYAVASLGTALTETQGRLLKKYAEEIVICFDADTAGQAATMRSLELLSDLGCNVKVLRIPDGKDPDEFLKKNGADEFLRLVERSIPLIDYKLHMLKDSIDTGNPEGRVKFLNKAAEVLSKVDNRMEQEIFARKLAKENETSEESILAEVYRKTARKAKTNLRNLAGGRAEAGSTLVRSTGAGGDSDKLLHLERLLLANVCLDNKVFRLAFGEMGKDGFLGEHEKAVAGFLAERMETKKEITPSELMDFLPPEVAGAYAKIMQEECINEDNSKAVLDIIKKIKIFKLDMRQRQILDMLNNSPTTEGDVERLKLELNSIMMKRKKL